MKKWFVRIVLLAGLVAVGIWVWGILFPNPERAIRLRLAEVAQAASFSGKEAPTAQALNSQRLTTFCTADIEIVVAIPGRGQHSVSGRDELFQGAMGARSLASALKVEFLDVTVTLAPDKQSAVANLTAKGIVPGEKDFLVQELKVKLKKIGREWYIQRLETVKSLSQRILKPQTSSFREGPNFKIENGRTLCFLDRARARVLKIDAWSFLEALHS